MTNCSCNERRFNLSPCGEDAILSVTCPVCCPPEDNINWDAIQTAIASKDAVMLLSLLKQTDPYNRISWADSTTSQAQLDRDVELARDEEAIAKIDPTYWS